MVPRPDPGARAGVGLRARAEDLAATLPPLLVAAERVAASVAAGLHGRRRVGPGETFWQFRRYQPGDPVRSIDWRRSARSDPVYVREHEWQAAQSVWLWCDRSASMDYHSGPGVPTKAERAALLTVALASLLVRGGEHIALLDGAASTRLAAGRAALLAIGEALTRPGPGAPSAQHRGVTRDGAVAGLEAILRTTAIGRHGVVVLVSDFLDPLPETAAVLRRLAAAGLTVHLLQVCDPAEETLPFTGRVRFVGLEADGEALVTRAEDIREAYLTRLAGHRAALATLARQAGGTFAVHRTDGAAGLALLSLFVALSQPPRFRTPGAGAADVGRAGRGAEDPPWAG